jgi:simple sugar transport system permease protein
MFKNKFLKIFEAIKPTLISIGYGLLIGLIIMLAVSPTQAFQGLAILLAGGFSDGLKGIGDLFYFSGPFILVGLSVGFAFKTGLFNIGASGQIMLGAFVSLYIGLNFTLPNGLHYVVAVIGGTIAGGMLGSLIGLLKAYFNVNEVVASIMLNYATVYFVIFFMSINGMVDSLTSWSKVPPSSAQAPNLNFNLLFKGSALDISIFIAVGAAIIIYIILNKTTLGFELKAVGFNPSGSKYAGISYRRNVIISMAISGALSGLAGAALFLNPTSGKRLSTEASILREGFDGITIALLGSSNPIGIIFSSLFIAHIRLGGLRLQLLEGISPEVISIIVASIIYLTAISQILQLQTNKIFNSIKKVFRKNLKIIFNFIKKIFRKKLKKEGVK